MTTRDEHPGFGKAPLVVDVLPLEQATSLLIERSGRTDEEHECRALAKALGRLPLALEQAGAYLEQHGVEVASYLEGFPRRKVRFLKARKFDGKLQGDYEATVANTWKISFDQLKDENPAAAAVLYSLAFLAPEEIPLKFFTHWPTELEAVEDESLEDRESTAREQLIRPLTRYSFVQERKRHTFSIHRLVQEVIRYELAGQDFLSETFEAAHRALDACFPEAPESPGSWEEGLLWMPHILQGLDAWRALELPPAWDPTRLWARAGFNAWAAGRASRARELDTEVVDVRRRVLGEEHPSTLISICNLLHMISPGSGGREEC